MNKFKDKNFRYVDFRNEFSTSEDLVEFIMNNTSLNVKEGIAGYVISDGERESEARVTKGMAMLFSNDNSSEEIGNLILTKLK